jgi:hypothetical protein
MAEKGTYVNSVRQDTTAFGLIVNILLRWRVQFMEIGCQGVRKWKKRVGKHWFSGSRADVCGQIDRRTGSSGGGNRRLIKANSSSKSERCFANETVVNVGLDSVVGMATCYGLDSSGIESRWEARFSTSSGPAVGPNQLPAQRVPGFFPGVKRPRRGVDHPPLYEHRG